MGLAWPRGLGEWRHVLVMGFMMVFASNGLNAWAIRTIPTNMSALLNGTAAFWIAGLGVFGRRGHPLTRRAVVGLVVGFMGTVLMLVPKGDIGSAAVTAQIGALGACFAWSLGTVYYRSIDTNLSPLMFSALQLLLGGCMFLAVAVMHGDFAVWTPNTPGIVALTYLTLFSSCLAFRVRLARPERSPSADRHLQLRESSDRGVSRLGISRRVPVACTARRYGDHHRRRRHADAAGQHSARCEKSRGTQSAVTGRRRASRLNAA